MPRNPSALQHPCRCPTVHCIGSLGAHICMRHRQPSLASSPLFPKIIASSTESYHQVPRPGDFSWTVYAMCDSYAGCGHELEHVRLLVPESFLQNLGTGL